MLFEKKGSLQVFKKCKKESIFRDTWVRDAIIITTSQV